MASVVKPELVWIGGACFRKNPVENRSQYFGRGTPAPGCGDTADAYEGDFEGGGGGSGWSGGGAGESEYREAAFDVRVTEGGKHVAELRVASAFYPMLIGKKGATKKRLESETRTKVNIPRQGVENEPVVVTGQARADVLSACSRVELMVESSRRRMQFTHFISVPLNTPAMQESFNEFKSKVLEVVSADGGAGAGAGGVSERKIDDTVFQTPSLLHMTVGVLALMDDYEREKATKLLQDCLDTVIRPGLGSSSSSSEFRIKIRGLEIMNDDPSMVDVVYAKITDNADALQAVADALVEKFAAAGLMAKQYDRVKLHVTVLNSLYRNRMEDALDGDKADAGPRVKMDARALLAQLGNYDFGTDVPVKEFHLSQRRAGKRTDANYYYPSTVVKL